MIVPPEFVQVPALITMPVFVLVDWISKVPLEMLTLLPTALPKVTIPVPVCRSPPLIQVLPLIVTARVPALSVPAVIVKFPVAVKALPKFHPPPEPLNITLSKFPLPVVVMV